MQDTKEGMLIAERQAATKSPFLKFRFHLVRLDLLALRKALSVQKETKVLNKRLARRLFHNQI